MQVLCNTCFYRPCIDRKCAINMKLNIGLRNHHDAACSNSSEVDSRARRHNKPHRQLKHHEVSKAQLLDTSSAYLHSRSSSLRFTDRLSAYRAPRRNLRSGREKQAWPGRFGTVWNLISDKAIPRQSELCVSCNVFSPSRCHVQDSRFAGPDRRVRSITVTVPPSLFYPTCDL